jgi:uncharacterized protein YjeT (DUF2065 family)
LAALLIGQQKNSFQREGKKHIMRYFICVLGMVMIIEGLPYFAFPDKIKPWLQKLIDTPEGVLRRLGFGLMLAGLALVYLGRLS